MSCNHVAVCLRRFSLLFLFFSIINIQHMKYDARICFFFCIVFSFFFLPFRLCHSVSVLRLITYRILMWYRYICLASNLDFVMNYIYFFLSHFLRCYFVVWCDHCLGDFRYLRSHPIQYTHGSHELRCVDASRKICLSIARLEQRKFIIESH